jgi:hypothetical protein
MVANPKISIREVAAQATARAADHLWREIVRARHQRNAAESTIEKYAETLELLIEGLPEPDRGSFQKKLADVKRETSPDFQRMGEVSGNVIELFRSAADKRWTVSDVQNKLSEEGKPADTKSVYNTMNYLVKTGLLQRISRGVYCLREFGFGLDADQLPDDGTMRGSEHYRCSEHYR